MQQHLLTAFVTNLSTGSQAPKPLLLADGADTARNALPARFSSKKRGDACEDIGHINGFIKNHDYTRSHSRTDGASCFEGERDIQFVGADEHARSAAEQDRLN